MGSALGPHWVTERLAVGNIEDAMDPSRLRQAGIGGVLGLNRFPSLAHAPGIEWARVELIDGAGNRPEAVLDALRLLEDLLVRHRVLVHCDEGRSRSPFITTCYLARASGRSFEEALRVVEERLPQARIDPGLLALRDAIDLRGP